MTNGAGPEQHGYRFGEFRLYPAQRLLLRGDEKLDVSQVAFSFILFMIENPGRRLTKKEVSIGVWAKADAGDTTLGTYSAVFRSLFGTESLITLNSQSYQCTLVVERVAGLPPELLPSSGARPSNTLPPRSASRIGREGELAQAAADIGRARLLTVVGPGGIGKSWLARELGWRLSGNYPDGLHLVDLAPVKDAAGVASATAKALGIALRGAKAPIEVIAASIRDRGPVLLIFDSCEYVAAAAGAFIAALQERARNLSVLATSQQILNIPDGLILRLEPLVLPDAVTLFVERVRAIDRRFKQDDSNAASVTEICRRVGCIPHALELAAGRVPALGIEAVRAGLERDERFRMLDNGPPTATGRQQTLLATVDWSHGLLDAGDQKTFRRLTCFSGSFSAEAAIAVAGGDGATRWDIINALHRLVDKSLLEFEDGEQPRYHFLETLQHYGTKKLEENGEAETIADLHIGYFEALFDPADESWETTPDAEWLRKYRLEIDNVRVALDRALEKPERTQQGIALCGATGRLWYMLSLVPEGRRYCEKFIALIDGNTLAGHGGRLLKRSAMLWRFADRQRGVALMEQSAALYRQVEDPANLGSVLGLLGGDYYYLGRRAEAKAVLDQARELLSGSNRVKSQINVMTDLGNLALAMNETDEALRYYTTACDLARQAKDIIRETTTTFNLGEAAFRRGAIDEAIEYAREAASGLRSAGQVARCGPPLSNLATYLIFRGDLAEARTHATEALLLLVEEGGHWLRLGLQQWALLGALAGRHAEAAQLVGWVDAEYGRTGEIREPTEQRVYDFLLTVFAENLAPESIQSFAAEGARWSEDRAVDFTSRRIVSPEDSGT
jgi:predicted ATPase